MIIVDHLRIYPLFVNLSDDELHRLSMHLVKRSFAKGSYLYHPGAPGLNLFLIESGWVRMFFVNDRQEEFLINLVSSPDYVGLPLLPDNQVRIAGAATLCDTVALLLSRDALFDFMRQSPQLAFNIYMEMSNTIRLLMGYARGIATLSLTERLARVFLHLFNRYTEKGTNELELPISQSDLASLIGGSRGRVNRALAQMQDLGLLHMDGQKVRLMDRAGLLKMAKV